MDLITNIIDSKSSKFEESNSKKVWWDDMVGENNSIMMNDVSEIMSIPKEKLVVTTKWHHKVKHVVDRSVEKCKPKFMAHWFS